jgi:hypothetical protein
MSESIDRLYKEAEERLRTEKERIITKVKNELRRAKEEALKL